MPPILVEVQVLLNQGSASIGIVSDSIAMDDGIDQGQGKKEEQKENTLEQDFTLRRLRVRFQRKMNHLHREVGQEGAHAKQYNPDTLGTAKTQRNPGGNTKSRNFTKS